MWRVLLTALFNGAVFISLSWLQTKQAPEVQTFWHYWQLNMNPFTWALMLFMVGSPALAIGSCKRQSLRGRGLLLINGLFIGTLAWIYTAQGNQSVWSWWLVYSVVMLGISMFARLSTRVAQVPQHS